LEAQEPIQHRYIIVDDLYPFSTSRSATEVKFCS